MGRAIQLTPSNWQARFNRAVVYEQQGRRGITPSTALRLARYLGVSPDFWMNLQLRWDLYLAQQKETEVLAEIQPCRSAA